MHVLYQYSRAAILLLSFLNSSILGVSLVSSRPSVLGKLLFILPCPFIFFMKEDIQAIPSSMETARTKQSPHPHDLTF